MRWGRWRGEREAGKGEEGVTEERGKGKGEEGGRGNHFRDQDGSKVTTIDRGHGNL